MPMLAQMHAMLQRMTYPATREELVDQAIRAGASEEIIARHIGEFIDTYRNYK